MHTLQIPDKPPHTTHTTTTSLFHSTAIFTCPNQEIAMMRDGVDAPAPGVLSLGILNEKLNGVIAVDAEKHQMRVGAGMDMNGLFKAATANSMSVQVRGCVCFVYACAWACHETRLTPRSARTCCTCSPQRRLLQRGFLLAVCQCTPPCPHTTRTQYYTHTLRTQLMTLPFYAGLTLGGILATSSHGTGDRVPSALVDMVTEVVSARV